MATRGGRPPRTAYLSVRQERLHLTRAGVLADGPVREKEERREALETAG